MYEAAVFYVFGAVLLLSGLAVVTARNPVHGALFLVLAFFTASAIWLLLRAEFLAITAPT
jgi:NADH-quinone oxidoreductase subunit J